MHPQAEIPFHLVVRLHVRERVDTIANLELPILAELELLGDERTVETNAAGTEYEETITVVAHRLGEITIAPATLQAIDPRDGHAKEYNTNELTLQVQPATTQPLQQGESAAFSALQWTGRIALWMGGLACVAGLLTLVFMRRPSTTTAYRHEPISPPQPIAAQSERNRMRDALTVLQAERSRAAAIAVRAAIWQMVGASEGETLDDVLRRPAAAELRPARLLRSLERAAFTYDDDLQAAINDACTALERCIGGSS